MIGNYRVSTVAGVSDNDKRLKDQEYVLNAHGLPEFRDTLKGRSVSIFIRDCSGQGKASLLL